MKSTLILTSPPAAVDAARDFLFGLANAQLAPGTICGGPSIEPMSGGEVRLAIEAKRLVGVLPAAADRLYGPPRFESLGAAEAEIRASLIIH